VRTTGPGQLAASPACLPVAVSVSAAACSPRPACRRG
jgi:hypothetical protein